MPLSADLVAACGTHPTTADILVAQLERIGLRLSRLCCDAWFDYVPSASNIADLPTRLDDDAIARLNRVARRVPLRLPPEWSLSCPLADLRALFV